MTEKLLALCKEVPTEEFFSESSLCFQIIDKIGFVC